MTEMNPIQQRIDLVVTETVQGNAAKHLKDVERQLAKINKVMAKYKKSWGAISKVMASTTKNQAKFTNQQKSMQAQISRTTEKMRKQNKALGDFHRSATRADKSARSLHLSWRTLAGGAAALYIGRRMNQLAESGIQASLLGGLGIGKQIGTSLPAGVSSTKALQFVGSAIADSLPLQFQGNHQTTAALMKILEQTKFLGADVSGKLTSEFLKAFEGDRQKLYGFLQSVNQNGARTAIQAYANQANLPTANQLLNAIDLDSAKNSGSLDPVTEAAVKLKDTFEALQAKMDEVIVALADKLLPVLDAFSKLPVGAQAGILGVGLLGPSALSFLGGVAGGMLPGLGKGALRGLGRGLGAGGRGIGVIGRGLGTLPYGAAWAHAMEGLGAAAPAALAVGAPAVAAGSLWTMGRSIQTAQLERTALGALERSMGSRDLFDVASNNKGMASTELDRLRAERQRIDAMLLAAPTSPGMKPGFFSPDIPEADAGQIAKLREQRRKIHEQIQKLQVAPVEHVTDKFSGLMEKAKAAVTGLGDKLQDFAKQAREAQAAQEYRLKQERFLKLQDLAKDVGLADAQTNLKRAEFELAKMHILGPVAAMPQLNALQNSIDDQTKRLTEYLANIDQSTKDGMLEATKTRTEIVGLQMQSKALTMELQSAVLGSIQAQALQAGKFEQILITRDRNLRIGLEKGIIQQPQISTISGTNFFGSTTPSGRKSIRITAKPHKVARSLVEGFNNVSKTFEEMQPMIQELQDMIDDDTVQIDRPGGRGRTSL